MICLLLHYLLSFVTVTSSAHQRFLCCIISPSATISVPRSVRVRRYYGPPPPRGGVHLVTVPQGVAGDCLPWGGEGQVGGTVPGVTPTRRGRGVVVVMRDTGGGYL